MTGANGFIGSWVVETLLKEGYTTIHAAIFPGSDASHLFSLSGATNQYIRLLIFEADILDGAAVARAVEGCSGVFHVASPCTLEDPKDPEKELILPAVQGTLNVLEAARRFNVRRVVLTSSISALVPNPAWPPQIPFDESSWTDLDYCKCRQLYCRNGIQCQRHWQRKQHGNMQKRTEWTLWQFIRPHVLDRCCSHV